MFEINSSDTPPPTQEIRITKVEEELKPAAAKKPRSKAKAKSFVEMQKMITSWQPSDPQSSRKMLSSEIMNLLEDNGFTCIKACIPSIIVEGQFPIDLIHFHSDNDIYEFLTRMMWMQQEYGKALGIMIGMKDDATVAKFEEACDSLLASDSDCLVVLL